MAPFFKITMDPEIGPEPENWGPDVGVIVGISLASLILISVVLGFTLWYCKNNQFLCFAQKR